MKRILLLSAALLSLGAEPAPLTLDQAIAEAEATSDRLRLQQVAVDVAASEPLADPRAGAPSLRLSLRDLEGSGGDYNDSPGDPEFVARARVPLPRPWDLATAARQGAATVDREEAQLDAVRADLRLEVTRYFHAVPALRDAAAIADRLAEVAADHLALVDRRRAEGLSTELEWLDSEEERRDADDDRAGIRSNLRQATSEFALLLGRPPNAAIDVVAVDLEARALAATPPAPDAIDAVVARSPAVAEARADIERAEQRLLRVKLRGLPWLDWFQGGVVLKSENRPRWEIGAAVDIPFTLWGPARSQEAELDLAGSKIRLEAVERRVATEALDAARDASAARDRWLVERKHHQALVDHAAPIIDLADPLVRLQLRARIVRAELRSQLALIDYIRRLDRLDALVGS